VAALEALEVHNGEGAPLACLDREAGVDDGVERGGDDGMIESQVLDAEVDISEFRVDGDVTGGDRDFVEPVGGS
jgi:hypothetical protein